MSNSEKPSSSNSSDPICPPKAVFEEFDRAMNIRATNPKKAMGIAESMCAKHSEIPLAHFCRGSVLADYACSLNDEAKNKPKLLNNALESLQKSMSMNPTPSCSRQIAKVLYEMANDDEGYAKVVQECERGLSMANSYVTIKNEVINELQNLIKMAKAGQEFKNQRTTKHNRRAVVPRRREFQVKASCTDHSEVSREEENSNQEFVKRVGDYWRNLHYYQKSKMMQVVVANLEGLYLSAENRNLRAVNILKDAIESYRKKKHWITWSCCLCEEDENEGKYENWSSIERHIDMHHFYGTSKVEGSIGQQWIVSSFDLLELVYVSDDDHYTSGLFKFDMSRLLGNFHSNPAENNRFLTKWLRDGYNVKRGLDSWKKRKVSRREMGIEIAEQIAKEMQETAANSQGSPSTKLMRNENIMAYKQEAVHLSAYDYREVLLPLLKNFIQGRLDHIVMKAKAEADAAMARLLEEVSLDEQNEPTPSKESKKKKGKQKAKGIESSEQKSEQSETSITDKSLEHENKVESHQEELETGVQHEKEHSQDDQVGRIQFGTITSDILNRIYQI